MTDGPLRSLPLPKPWKTVADDVCRNASIDEVSRRMGYAILRLVDAKVICTVSEILKTVPVSLFADGVADLMDRLELVRTSNPSPFTNTLVESAQTIVLQGYSGEDADERTFEMAIRDFASSMSRSIAEHWQRKAGLNNGKAMGSILKHARSKLPFCDLRPLVGLKSGEQTNRLGLSKRKSIDDGPPL
jgi:hypothetical protein